MSKNKQTPQDRLEAQRPQRLFIGLTVALACLFVALEYSIEPSDPLDDPDLLSQIDFDQDLPPMLQPENELALAPKEEPRPETRIVVVDNEEEPDLRQEEEDVEADLGSDLDAIGDEDDEPLPPPEDDGEEALSFRVVEDVPQFPGGATEFMKWLTRNLKYPRKAQERRLTGRVVAEFIVNKDGSVTNVRIVTPLDAQCDAEVLRVLRMMPRWTAGLMDGQPCRTKVCIPVVFRL